MIFLLFVLQSTVIAQFNAGENIAYDLFDYHKSDDDLTGGVGFSSAAWLRKNCDVVDFSDFVRPKPNFVSFGNTSLVGIRSDVRTIACTLSRQVNDPVISTDRFVSVLLSIAPKTMRSPAFVVAIGDLDVKEEFKAGGGDIQLSIADGELGGPGKSHVVMYGSRDVSTRIVHEIVAQTSDGMRSFVSATTPHVEVVGYFVCFKFEADSRMFQRVRARVFPIPVSGASNVSESGLYSAFEFNTSFPSSWTISIGLKEIFTSQVRVGTTFDSVYTDMPRLPSTPMPTTRASASNPAQLSTTTTQQQTLTGSLTSPISQSHSISDATTSMTLSSSSSCGQITTCAGCLSANNNNCQWCAQWRNNTMGQCVANVDDECLITTRTTDACTGETTAANDSVTADVTDSAAIIGGAVGGSIFALVLIVLVVYLVVRARRGKPRAANTEMTTARDESSAASRTPSNVYGELRLSNEYSQVPPTPEHYSVFPAPDRNAKA